MNESKKMHILMKMFKYKEYADDFRMGKLFANTLDYFQKLEGEEGQGDPYEGAMWSSEHDILTLMTPAGPFKITPDLLEHYLSFQRINHVNVVCFCEFRLPVEVVYGILSTPAEFMNEVPIPQKLQYDFGPHMVVIRDRAEFENRVNRELRKQTIMGHVKAFGQRPVQYEDYQPKFWDMVGIGAAGNNFLKPAFFKRSSFSYQSEYRIAFERDSILPTGGPYTLNIGDIRDITFYAKTSNALVLQGPG